ncbi:unnamed protein product, partial [marine sediment metagenome]
MAPRNRQLTHTITALLINKLVFALFRVKFVTDGIQLGSDSTGWQIRKATQTDIDNDDAHVVGNLIIIDLES